MTEQEIRDELTRLRAEAYAAAKSSIPLKIKIVLATLLVLLIVAAGFDLYKHLQHEQAVLMSQEQLKNAEQLASALNVSQAAATELQRKLAEAKTPVFTYTVQAPTVEKAAEQEQKRIQQGTSPANTVPADKTIVTPNTDQQKVDVYRVTLDKPRGIGVYASTESAGAMLQYKNVVLFGGTRYQGGYEVGAAYMVRF